MVCEICGKEFDKARWFTPFDKVCSSECFNDKFWLDIIKEKDEHIVVNGNCYIFNKEKPIKSTDTKYNGCAGRLFKIQCDNGEYYETNNLWHNGIVPEKFRSQLPDNAVFVK